MGVRPTVTTLAELLGGEAAPARAVPESLARSAVGGVCLDSRLLEAGDLYLAVTGASTHGLRHAADALGRGAVAVAFDPADVAADDALGDLHDALAADGAPLVEVPGLAERAPGIAARFHGHPDRALTLVAVTGTDGKTSVCRFVAAALEALGTPCGYVGTIGWGRGDALEPTALTTPDAVTLQRLLAALRDGGARAVALEASSHALAGGRLDALAIDVAVLTNLGRDHLDFHGDVDAYRRAKARLFGFPGLRAVVVNGDDPFGRDLATGEGLVRGGSGDAANDPGSEGSASGDGPLRFVYGVDDRSDDGAGRGGAEITVSDLAVSDRAASDVGAAADDVVRIVARDVRATADGLAFTLVDGDARLAVDSPLLGRFNVANLLACHGTARALGHAAKPVAAALGTLRAPAGRMERFSAEARPVVVVDYAHTPQALTAAIAATRAHCAGALWVVFGCGGDRDRGKRAPMGRAAEAADHVVVTDDNPRGEASADIIRMVLAGMASPARATVVPDRRGAIAHAIRSAAADDVVLVAGKGHEDYQIVGDTRLSLSDRAAVGELLAEAC